MSPRTYALTRRAGIVAGVALIASTLAWALPASAGNGPATGTVEIVKAVVGDAPEGSFEITLDCDTDGLIPLTFDGPGTQSLQLVGDTQDCDVVETEDLGALSVTYFCEDVVPPIGEEGCQPPGEGGDFFQVFDSQQVVRVTVTNTFADAPVEPTSSTTSTTAAATASAGVTPTFTG